MTGEERARLERRLIDESNKMRNAFATLAYKTRASLLTHNVSVRALKFLIENSEFYDKVYESIEDIDDFDKVMSCLSDYWSFFDYHLLEFIIKSCCSELTGMLEEYEGQFKLFCQRRLCEVPEGELEVRAEDKGSLCMKIDDRFRYKKSKVLDIKELEHKLSKLLDTKLVLRKIEKGCLELTFICLHAGPPLSSQLKQQLRELGVLKM